jgi:hypothetical protein
VVTGGGVVDDHPLDNADTDRNNIVEPTQTATCTATATSTQTGTPVASATATHTATSTATLVPAGGVCAVSSECAGGLLCVDDVCAKVAAQAPASSSGALIIALGLLIAIGRAAIGQRRGPLS